MIYTLDNFIPRDILIKLNKYLVDFKEVQMPGKKFWVMNAPNYFIDWIVPKISSLEGQHIQPILSFFRMSTNKLDIDWRIHCDSIIDEQVPKRALVLYISSSPIKTLHGTAFWSHKVHGDKLDPEELNTEKFNNILLNDSENLDMWNLNSIIGYKQNRLVSYPSNYFHSKYPNKSWEKGRKVFVMFYK